MLDPDKYPAVIRLADDSTLALTDDATREAPVPLTIEGEGPVGTCTAATYRVALRTTRGDTIYQVLSYMGCATRLVFFVNGEPVQAMLRVTATQLANLTQGNTTLFDFLLTHLPTPKSVPITA